MENLHQYFTYNKDCDISSIFYGLYKNMKIIHENGMCIPSVDVTHIIYDGNFSFDSMSLPNNFKIAKRENILCLTKLFLGAYLSIFTEFRDYSSVDTEWFSQNLGDIVHVSGLDDDSSNYFSSVLLNGEDSYYCDYIDSKNQLAEIGNKSSVRGYKKVLSNSASKFYQAQDEDESENSLSIEKKAAFVNLLFYPTLFFCLFIVLFVSYTCLKYFVVS